MAQQEFDLPEAASILWKVGAGIALILGLGALVRGKDSRLVVSTSERRYERDSLSGAVAVPVRMAAKHGTIWLHGCPRAPVVFLQREVDGLWVDEPREPLLQRRRKEGTTDPHRFGPDGDHAAHDTDAGDVPGRRAGRHQLDLDQRVYRGVRTAHG